MVSKIKNFLCTTSPENLAFGSIVILLVGGMIIWMPWKFSLIMLGSVVASAVVIATGIGLTTLIEKAQKKCKK